MSRSDNILEKIEKLKTELTNARAFAEKGEKVPKEYQDSLSEASIMIDTFSKPPYTPNTASGASRAVEKIDTLLARLDRLLSFFSTAAKTTPCTEAWNSGAKIKEDFFHYIFTACDTACAVGIIRCYAVFELAPVTHELRSVAHFRADTDYVTITKKLRQQNSLYVIVTSPFALGIATSVRDKLGENNAILIDVRKILTSLGLTDDQAHPGERHQYRYHPWYDLKKKQLYIDFDRNTYQIDFRKLFENTASSAEAGSRTIAGIFGTAPVDDRVAAAPPAKKLGGW